MCIRDSLLDSYGFITPVGSGENIFFHASELMGVHFRDLRQGDPVTYLASHNDRGPCARRVELLSMWPTPGEAVDGAAPGEAP